MVENVSKRPSGVMSENDEEYRYSDSPDDTKLSESAFWCGDGICSRAVAVRYCMVFISFRGSSKMMGGGCTIDSSSTATWCRWCCC